MQKRLFLIVLLALLAIAGCGSNPREEPATSTDSSGKTTTASGGSTSGSKSPGLIDRITGKPITVPAGTVITVRLGEALGSKLSQDGQSFSATVAEPIEVDGKTAIPSGSAASGTVVAAKALGKFKGGAVLQIRLDSVTVGGKNYAVETASVNRSIKGKGKRTATMIGGGAGAGALIGALAGGGKGAAIGAAVGAGAGTAGAAYTGNKEIVLPAESAVSFKTLQAIDIKQ
jgi:hypothetical protein